jgi:hypothetical protein
VNIKFFCKLGTSAAELLSSLTGIYADESRSKFD